MQTNSRCLRRFRRAAVASRRPDRGPVALCSNATTGAARLLGVDALIPTADPAPLRHVLIGLGHGSLLLSGAPEGRHRHRRERPRYWEIFELESRKHHGALWWSRRTALAAFGDFFFWASGHGLEAIRGAYSVNPRASLPPSRAYGVIDQYEHITSHLGEI